MPRIAYDFDNMESTAQSLTSQADDVRKQVEGYWGLITTDADELPSRAARDTSPNLNDCLSLMIKTLAQILALRANLGTQLANATAAAQQCENDNTPPPPRRGGHGPIPF